MRVFLRNKKTRLYCAESNRWTGEVGQACDFTSVPRAARFVRDQKLPGLEIILKYDTLQDEVVVPVLAEWCDIDRPRSAAA